MVPQAASSKSGFAHAALSPVWNFHKPFSTVVALPRTTCLWACAWVAKVPGKIESTKQAKINRDARMDAFHP